MSKVNRVFCPAFSHGYRHIVPAPQHVGALRPGWPQRLVCGSCYGATSVCPVGTTHELPLPQPVIVSHLVGLLHRIARSPVLSSVRQFVRRCVFVARVASGNRRSDRAQ